MVSFIKSDLQFILEQIQIAERNAAGEPLRDILPNVQVPFGLRTVDGSFNNLVLDQSAFGAADGIFPRLTTPVFGTAEAGTSYAQTSGLVIDSEPRTISNLIVDQTDNNPAAVAAAAANPNAATVISPGLDGIFGTADDTPVNYIPNVTPDVGLSTPFNAWMTFFGQFFDHGLDLVTKGGSGTVFIPLKADDPLFVPGSPTNFMVLTRATNLPGPDGILGNADDVHEAQNTTSPFVDQNQTYTSHPAHQFFLRAYELDAAGHPVATGKLITNRDLGADGKFGTADDHEIGGMATWKVVKAQARDILGIDLTDANVFDVPLVATDAYGNFIRGPHGMPMVMMKGADGKADTADDFLVEGNRPAPISLANAVGTGHQFLIDIAHSADPSAAPGLVADGNSVIGGVQPAGTYDDELLDAHYIAGDGRVNENIGLTSVHAIFHAEHNRLVEHTKQTVLDSNDLAFLNQWLLDPVASLPTSAAQIAALHWNGERLFQAAKFGTEMQYQHLVFEEFARTVQPQVDEFLAPAGYDTTIDPSIVAEFAHTVYRFGHSMLTETVDRFDPNFNPVTADPLHPTNDQQLGLIAAFLNPLAYAASGPTPEQATGAIVRGVTRTVGNEIDEFVTEALRNNLVGLPLDLAVLNLARGRDAGIPSLNAARREFYDMTGDSQLKPYISWADLVQHLKHPESVINFIAAYGTHASITGATTLAAKRDAAAALVLGGDDAPADRLDFLNSTGAWASGANGVTTTGLDDIDFWIGGLAEEQMPFGGLLGSTFNFVFETQLENLQNGDRFYYLSRTAGMHFGTELENNSFAKLVMLNTDVTHLNNNIFGTPTWILEVDQTKQFNEGLGHADPTGGIEINGIELVPLVIRNNPNTVGPDANYLQYTGEDHVVLGGTAGNDIIVSGDGDDTVYGDAGNDRLEGGFGNDTLLGGAGDDIIQDQGGDDRIEGGDGNDVIQAGNNMVGGVGNLILGGRGKDFIITTEDISTTFGGEGDDFILGAKTNLPPTGNEGDDWIELGTQDGAPGDNFNPLLADNVVGNDIFVGGGGFDEMIGEGGDDIFVGSDAQDKMDGMSGFDWVTYKNDRFGVTVDLTLAAIAQPHGNAVGANVGAFQPVGASPASILDRFAEVEGLSGSRFGDILRGDDVDAVTILNHGGATGGALTNVALIGGLQALLGAGATGFATGNIILGGDGSDIIEGRGGDDLIDGDRWLNVRISVRQNIDGTGPEIRSVNGMAELIPDMLDGRINPGQLVAVREIMNGVGGFDTAVFSGVRADYTITIDNNGTPLNFADDIVTVADSVAGRDGTDTLKHIERLEFADQKIVVVPGLNAEPVGAPTILDGVTNLADNTPTSGQLLRVSIAGVTDGDNPLVGGVRPVTGSVSYFWQVERTPGTGVFEDIVLLPAGDLAFQSADGSTFRVTPDLAGLSLRVKAIYQDAQGVTETVFSAPTASVAAGATPTPTAIVTPPDIAPGGAGIQLVRSDLAFILDQIKIAEAHAAGADLASLLPNVRMPLGLRAVDGSNNNLVPNQGEFGAADTIFPRLTDPVFKTAEAAPPGFGPPGAPPTSYQQTSGAVFDSQPRTISNLIVDQTDNNPAAVAAAAGTDGSTIVVSPGLDGLFGTADDKEVNFIPNVAPDAGLSAPFNAWMTFFGQFFDHGLDLVTKGGSGTVFIPLKPDDPLFVPGSPTNFMVLTRATNRPGPDGILGTTDDIHEQENTTSPFVDQNQTYTSHPSHQVFLRAYDTVDGHPVATGKLIVGRDLGADGKFGTADDLVKGGMATWAVVKAQARDVLGINLTDADVFDVPLLATDAYGNFIKGPHGFPQVVMKGADGLAGTADDVLVEGNPAAPISLVNAVRTGHQFLIDVAHSADPTGATGADADAIIGNAVPVNPVTGLNVVYDNELLDAHYIAGDGRVNENIGLTAVHSIFHSEHNRLVDQTKQTVLASNDLAFLNEWLLNPVASLPVTAAQINALHWNGERLFQVAKFGTEMQYQHLVFEEFARTIQPNVDLFFAPTQVYDADLNPAIVAEFAHTVYRFGHSMLTETVDRFDPNFNPVVADPLHPTNDEQLGLIAAFLNPLAFAASGPTPEEATGAIVRGTTRTVGNEIDEFVTEALRNNLVGLPLDLAVLNLARGRDVGIPSLNAARRDFYQQTGDSQLKPYTSWVDLLQHLKHPESVINFIAAYGTHSSITSATTLVAKRAAATALVLGGDGAPADRFDFLNGTGAWANLANGVTRTGVDDIDFWIGGLAEEKMPFGGMLGSTFNFVFENQLEKLQDGDRFYYLERTAGLNFNAELEGNSFAKLIMANSSATHLPALVFSTPTWTLEVDASKQFTGLGMDGRADPTEGGILLTPLVIRDNPTTVGPDGNYLQYTGEDHVVLGGTEGNDILVSSIGDDTIWGDGGNDRIEGGDGNDQIRGGAGDDIITDTGGDDNIQGGDGNDVIQGGNGVNLIIGGFGSDFIITGEDASEAIGGQGNDFILGSKANEQDMGNEGDDWIEKGTSDGAPGDNFDPLGNDPVIGNDVFIGGGENDKFNAEGGDDIMVGSAGQGDRYIGGSGFDWATFKDDPFGVTIDISNRFFDQPVVPGSGASILARFDIVEGLSGSAHADWLAGDDLDAAALATAGAHGSVLTNIALINGLQQLLGAGVTFFDGGNIILGGAGSDRIMGRGGDDRIDGDAWLNVRISVRDKVNPNIELKSADSMTELVQDMLSGKYNPGQLQIVREIKYSATADFDTAIFSGDLANYTFTVNGVAVSAAALAGIGTSSVVRVTDTVGTDGTDTLTHIERLQFADQAVVLNGLNQAPVGAVTLLDAARNVVDNTPARGELLRASIAGVTDGNNVGPGNPTGAINSAVSYFWQIEAVPGSGVFEDLLADFAAGEVARVGGPTFTPTDAEVGLRLRVRAVYKDANGVLEEAYSAPTAAIVINNPATGAPTISDTTPTEDITITASSLGIVDPDGITTSVFSYQWQQSADNVTWTDIGGATEQSFTPGSAQVLQLLRVRVSFEDDLGSFETLFSAPTGRVGDHIIGTAGAETLTGTPFDDWVEGLGGNDVLDGGAGNDLLAGNAGDDLLRGGVGADTMQGGTGNDTYEVDNAGDVVTEAGAGGGTDLVRASVSYTLGNGVENLTFTGTGAFTGTGNALANVITGGNANDTLIGNAGDDTLIGGAGNDTLIGNAGDDTLSGGTGADNMQGGIGNDTYEVDNAADVVTDVANGGTDTVRTSLNAFALAIGNNVENLTFVGGGNFTGTGNELANVITADAGNDTLNGGVGADRMIGGAGNDAYTVDNVGDVIVENSGGGTDSVSSSVNYTLGDNLENLTLTGGAAINATGNALANVLVGNAGANLLDGRAGADNMAGGAGNDTYVVDNVGDVVTEAAAAGTDTVQTTLAAYTLGANVENLTFTGSGSFTGTGNALANVITAGAGNDLLDGGGGADRLVGGLGNDTYRVDNTGDVIVEVAGEGTDTVITTTVQFTLGANLENLIFAGNGSFTGTGNALANALTGGNANDALSGGAGDDRITGGAGNDRLTGGAGSDRFVFAPGFGQDRIDDFDSNPVGGQDVIDLSAFHITFANLSVTNGGGGTLVTVAAGQTILLQGVGLGTIDQNDFQF